MKTRSRFSKISIVLLYVTALTILMFAIGMTSSAATNNASAVADNGGTIEAEGGAALSGSTGDELSSHIHTWSSAWTFDATHHWHACTADDCDATDLSAVSESAYAAHTFTNGACPCGINYLTFSSSSTFTLATKNASVNWNGTLEYSTDLITWTVWNGAEISSSEDGKLYLRGTGNTKITGASANYRFVLTGSNIACAGNILTLLDYATVFNGDQPQMANNAFSYLFYNSKVLTSAPELPAMTLSENCYASMFYDCSALTEAPALPAETLATYCYAYMFDGCTLLKEAPELPATTLAPQCYYYMFSYCPSLKVAPELPATELAASCYYHMFSYCTALEVAPDLPADTLATYCYANMFNYCTALKKAPVLSATVLENYCYAYMFNYCTSLAEAPKLPATFLATYCYTNMFNNCTSLTAAPELSAETLATFCYSNMFKNAGLLTAPALPATTLATSCYANMFEGCTSLKTAPTLPAETLAANCYHYMFKGCSALEEAPKLPATTLASYCYAYMFNGCTALTTAPDLPAETLATHCYRNMFSGCTGLTQVPKIGATSLADYACYYMFYGCENIKVAQVQTSYYNTLWSIASTGAETDLRYSLDSMFNRTGGSFTDSPVAGATYYYHGYHSYIDGYCDGETHLVCCSCGELAPDTTPTACDYDDASGICSRGSVRIDEAHFPDWTLRQSLTGYDADENGILTTAELRKITELDFSRVSINSMDGLEYLPHLYKLDFYLCTFPENNLLFSKELTNITYLACRYCDLTALDVSRLVNLTELYCQDNALTELDLSSNTLLRILYCSSNHISSLTLSNSPLLEQVTCNSNNLSGLDLSHCGKLIEIYCSGNNLLTLLLNENAPITSSSTQQNAIEIEIDQKTMTYILDDLENIDASTIIGVETSGYTLDSGVLSVPESTNSYQQVTLRIATGHTSVYLKLVLNITNPHAHLYVLSSDGADADGHTAVCACTASVTDSHTVDTYLASEEGHYSACVLCGYATSAAEAHSFDEDGICTACLAKKVDEVIYLPWNLNDTLPTLSGNYYLTTAVTLNSAVNVSGDVTLDLNGKNVTYGGTISTDYINILSGAALHIYDLSTGTAGTIGDTATSHTSSIRVHKGGALCMYSGKIAVKTSYYCIKVAGTFRMYGGSVKESSGSGCCVRIDNLAGNNPVVYIDNTAGKISLSGSSSSSKVFELYYYYGAGSLTLINLGLRANTIMSCEGASAPSDSNELFSVYVKGGTYTMYNYTQVYGAYVIEDATITGGGFLFYQYGTTLKLVGNVSLSARIEIDSYDVFGYDDVPLPEHTPLDITEFTGTPFTLHAQIHNAKIAKGDINKINWYYSAESMEQDPTYAYRIEQEGEYIVSYHCQCFLYYNTYNGDGTHTTMCYYCQTSFVKECTFEYNDGVDACNTCGGTRTHVHVPNEDDNNCTTDILCSICNAVATAGNHAHSYDHACDTDCNIAGCTAGNRTTSHVPDEDDGNCTTEILCSVCKVVTTTAETHSYTYSVNGDTITEICSNAGCTAHTATATVSAPAGTPTYDGTTQFAATVHYSDTWAGGTLAVSYTEGGSSVTDLTGAGTYVATITLGDVTASISYTVEKATLDMSGVTLENMTIKTNGEAHSILVGGTLPAGVTVTYEGNEQTDAGIYTVTAIFSYDEANYTAVAPITATLTIHRDKVTGNIGDASAETPHIEASAEDGFDPRVEIVIAEVPAEGNRVETVIGAFDKVSAVYDITLQSDGVSVQPSGEITIKLLIPEDLRGEEFKIYHNHDGAFTEVAFTVDGDYAVFTTAQLSEFSFVYYAFPWWIIVIILVVVAAAGGTTTGIILYKKKKSKKA